MTFLDLLTRGERATGGLVLIADYTQTHRALATEGMAVHHRCMNMNVGQIVLVVIVSLGNACIQLREPIGARAPPAAARSLRLRTGQLRVELWTGPDHDRGSTAKSGFGLRQLETRP